MKALSKFLSLNSRGFTLVELMVVVSILAVLMAIVVPAIGGTKEQSVEGTVKSDADAVGKAVSNFNNKSIKPAFPEQSLTDHPLATPAGIYTDILAVGGGTKGANVSLYRTQALFDAATHDGTTGLRPCTAGSGDTANCELLSKQITKPGTTTDVDKRTILHFFHATNIYDTDGSVKNIKLVPDFLSKEPGSLILKSDETKTLTSNTYEEFIWVLTVNAPGSSQDNRTVEVFRVVEALCDGADAGTKVTVAECDSTTLVTSEIKHLNALKVF